jgi:diguanylate cyclase (GGDEF)-like protein
MERASTPARVAPELDAGLLAAAAQSGVARAGAENEPPSAIDAAVGALHEALPALFPAVFVLEHGRLWLVAQRGYAVVPDGIRVDQGVMGRAIRLETTQLADDLGSDPDYLGVLPSVVTELAIPLRAGGAIVGMLNVESELALPDEAATLLEPLAAALTPLAEAVRAVGGMDLAALARLFVHLGGLRDTEEIAGLAAASLSRVLPVATSQVVVWNEIGAPVELAAWSSEEGSADPLTLADLAAARAFVGTTVVSQQLVSLSATARGASERSHVWLPLRSSGADLGAMVAAVRPGERVDAVQLDTAAVLAAHVAASLDIAVALQAERQSAVTDSLTGIMNRRGLEERLEHEVALAQERRRPLSLLVIDCDDFKDINDRAGHEFGDTLLYEIARVLVRSLPEGAVAARLGGDEFVVMLAGAGAHAAVELGSQLRVVLAEGLTDAGFPLRVSAGISTYPFDGATPSALLRAADQALYAAKNAGKDRVASFSAIARPDPSEADAGADTPDGRRRARGAGSVLADVVSGSLAIDAEETVDAVCSRLCKSLVFVVGVTACSASRLVGDHLVDATEHALRAVSLGDEAAYRLADFPLTEEVLRSGRPRAVSFLDGDVDPAEAFVLRELGMSSLLLLPLEVKGAPWGLVEVYEMRMRRFTEDDIVVARFLVGHAERRLAALGADTEPPRQPPVYKLPPPDGPPRTPRTR